MKTLFDTLAIQCSRYTTRMYSTSFSLGILCLDKKMREPIYSIYGFVRFADEIVDSFHGFDKQHLLAKFREDTFEAIRYRISLNPILHSFQEAVHAYSIDEALVHTFLNSMEMDLTRKSYDMHGFEEYIYGSAEVVGLMCLKVFCQGDQASYEQLKPYAMKLGSAFQKINFLRDLKTDYATLGRAYFPGLMVDRFDDEVKRTIEEGIAGDFSEGLKGIKLLPKSSRFGVYVAYIYYRALFNKIQGMPVRQVMEQRIRIRNRHKARLLVYSYFKFQLNLI